MGAVAVAGRELGWWFTGLRRLLWRYRSLLLVAVGVTVIGWAVGFDLSAAWGLLAGVGIGLGVWCRVSPGSFERLLAGPLRRRRTARRLARMWPALMESCGLAAGRPAERVHPALGRLHWNRLGQLSVPVGLLVGQTVQDFEAQTDRLRTAAGARSLRVVTDSARTGCELVWTFHDALLGVVPFVGPNPVAGVVPFDRCLIGVTEDGEPFSLDLQVSTLTVGVTGAGKASVMWNLILAQAPNIRTGLVEFHGADLKGAMELGIGAGLFTQLARTSTEAVMMLERAAAACDARARRMSGVARSHRPTLAEPMVIVLVDELAALVAYETDRDLLKRADAALRKLLAMGRAVGFYLLAFVQDPRKETVGMRHMFPQKIALRLDEAAEVDMVLGEGARRRGAEAHHISRATPGVGFAVVEDGQVVRFRAAHVTDELIRLIASMNPAAGQQPIAVPEPAAGRGRPTTSGDPAEGSNAAPRPRRRSRANKAAS